MHRALHFGERAVKLAEAAEVAVNRSAAQRINELASRYAALAVSALERTPQGGHSFNAALGERFGRILVRLSALRRRHNRAVGRRKRGVG